MNSHCAPWQSEYHLNNDQGLPLLIRCFLQKSKASSGNMLRIFYALLMP